MTKHFGRILSFYAHITPNFLLDYTLLPTFVLVMGNIKTRNKLIDVARQLFAKNGLDDTTMNDIAIASGRGRRTLYTYFKSKEEVFEAVVENEMEHMSNRLRLIADKDLEPEDKLVQLVYTT